MAWYRRLLNLGRTARLNAEIEREMAFHVAERAEALQAAGLSEEEALREARRRLGNATLQRERTRDADVFAWADSLVRDVRHAVRSLGRSPVFACVAVASLALGIGANTAIFTLIDAVVLRPLPVQAPHELVVIGTTDEPEAWFTNPLWEQIRDRETGLTAAAAYSEAQFDMADGGEARRVFGAYVSGDYFRMFGVRPAAGRLLGASDDVRSCPPVAVLGHGFWRSEFGNDTRVMGRTLSLEGIPFEIVGVARAGFRGPHVGREVQVFVPVCTAPAVSRRPRLDSRAMRWLTVMGRRDGASSVEQVNARLAAISPASFEATLPEGYTSSDQQHYRERRFMATAAASGVSGLRDRYAAALGILMASVALVLLISCANVANLQLARAASRQREFAIRVAIGAGRARVVRQLMTESLLLALLGAGFGLVIARFGAHGLVALITTSSIPLVLNLSLNTHVLGFTAGVAVLTALLFGLMPAWRASRVNLHTTMCGRGIAEGHGRFTIGKALVAAQVALSLILLVGAGLLVGSLRRLTTLDPGFTAEGVLVANADMRRAALSDEQLAAARAQALARMRATPGVVRASTSEVTPIGGLIVDGNLIVDGFTSRHERDAVVFFNDVGDDYFATLDTRLLAGRDFDASDVAGAPSAAIVNDAVARKFFGATDAVGRTFRLRQEDEPHHPNDYRPTDPITIVGVVEEAKYESLRDETSPTVYMAASQFAGARPYVTLVLRADGNPATLIPAVKDAFHDLHPAITVDFSTLSDQVSRSLQRERTMAVLSSVFGALALGLAVLGLYGVISYVVVRRRNEIGIRIALGADRARVLRLVLVDVGRVLALGLAVGVAGSIAAGRLVESFLYGLSAAEPIVLGTSLALLALVALCAGALPAWRAARTDPASALRDE